MLAGGTSCHGKMTEHRLLKSVRLFWREKKVSNKNFGDHNIITTIYLPSINAEIDRRDDGDVRIARELSDALLAKICWGILIP